MGGWYDRAVLPERVLADQGTAILLFRGRSGPAGVRGVDDAELRVLGGKSILPRWGVVG
ncbi:MAG: hypothetical protein MUQ32_10615 [Chloroflexi bacterium]|jgi:hypothetical protein|nr:hypothetical protein [Chloroflexota bacterium]